MKGGNLENCEINFLLSFKKYNGEIEGTLGHFIEFLQTIKKNDKDLYEILTQEMLMAGGAARDYILHICDGASMSINDIDLTMYIETLVNFLKNLDEKREIVKGWGWTYPENLFNKFSKENKKTVTLQISNTSNKNKFFFLDLTYFRGLKQKNQRNIHSNAIDQVQKFPVSNYEVENHTQVKSNMNSNNPFGNISPNVVRRELVTSSGYLLYRLNERNEFEVRLYDPIQTLNSLKTLKNKGLSVINVVKNKKLAFPENTQETQKNAAKRLLTDDVNRLLRVLLMISRKFIILREDDIALIQNICQNLLDDETFKSEIIKKIPATFAKLSEKLKDAELTQQFLELLINVENASILLFGVERQKNELLEEWLANLATKNGDKTFIKRCYAVYIFLSFKGFTLSSACLPRERPKRNQKQPRHRLINEVINVPYENEQINVYNISNSNEPNMNEVNEYEVINVPNSGIFFREALKEMSKLDVNAFNEFAKFYVNKLIEESQSQTFNEMKDIYQNLKLSSLACGKNLQKYQEIIFQKLLEEKEITKNYKLSTIPKVRKDFFDLLNKNADINEFINNIKEKLDNMNKRQVPNKKRSEKSVQAVTAGGKRKKN